MFDMAKAMRKQATITAEQYADSEYVNDPQWKPCPICWRPMPADSTLDAHWACSLTGAEGERVRRQLARADATKWSRPPSR